MFGVPGLKVIRVRSGYTQEELAKLVGVHSVSICRYETGKLNVRMRIIQRLADVLGCSIKDLMFPEDVKCS